MVCGMDDIELKNCVVRKRECEKVFWKQIPLGLIFQDEDSTWRITTDLKGEFWAFEEYQNKEDTIKSLVQKRQELDDYRVSLLESNSVK